QSQRILYHALLKSQPERPGNLAHLLRMSARAPIELHHGEDAEDRTCPGQQAGWIQPPPRSRERTSVMDDCSLVDASPAHSPDDYTRDHRSSKGETGKPRTLQDLPFSGVSLDESLRTLSH